MVNEYSFEIESIFVMRACVIKRVRADLYGTPCSLKEAKKTYESRPGHQKGDLGLIMDFFVIL